jgi:hypothetical protein
MHAPSLSRIWPSLLFALLRPAAALAALPIAAGLCLGCGGDDDAGDTADAAPAPDASPADAATDASAVDPDAAPACAAELASVDGRAAPRNLVLEGEEIYVLAEVGGLNQAFALQLWRFHRERGEPELLAELPEPDRAISSELVVSGDSLYVGWSRGEAGGGLVRVPRDGGEPVPLSTDGVDSLTADDTHVYWAGAYLDGEFEPTIRRRAEAGGDDEILLQNNDSVEAQLLLVGDDLLLNDNISLLRMPRAGGDTEFVGFLSPGCSGTRCIGDMLVADDILYWSEIGFLDDVDLSRSRLDVFEQEPIATDGNALDQGEDLYVVDGQLYWETQADDLATSIRRAPVEGGDPVGVPLTVPYRRAWVAAPDGIYLGDEGPSVRLAPLAGCPD